MAHLVSQVQELLEDEQSFRRCPSLRSQLSAFQFSCFHTLYIFSLVGLNLLIQWLFHFFHLLAFALFHIQRLLNLFQSVLTSRVIESLLSLLLLYLTILDQCSLSAQPPAVVKEDSTRTICKLGCLQISDL